MQLFSSNDVKKLGTVMGVWAHPDDESFMMAGLIAAAVQNAQTVVCITATRGEAGVQDETRWPATKLADIRTSEMESALTILGLKNHYWLDYPDGGCGGVNEAEAVKRISDLMRKFQPDTVITFAPDGLTGHPDHAAVSGWTREAITLQAKRPKLYYAVDSKEHYDNCMKAVDEQFNVYFNVDEPCVVPETDCDIVLKLTPELAQQKQNALAAMPSQTERIFKTFGQTFVNDLATETFVEATRQIKWATPKA